METPAAHDPFAPPAASPAARLGAEVDDETELTRLHPNFKKVLRIKATLATIPFLIAALFIEGALIDNGNSFLPVGVVIGAVLILAIVFVLRLPSRRYIARGYQISNDRLRVVRGILWRSDTVVPFGRVQHIDVDQGPLERFFDIATLTVHTAGNHNSSVNLPGLGHELATEMREEIRAHIKQESM
ncbi:hypothetical protein FGU71_06020 [Erythrobacter insulae]|uniref:YdbS-like PH domain-containing protein n=1 Tax=Erythrobacter insulae TaxID=2584124 RepID=A0A547PBD7_9SPHN|nr:PH domain-containing protein [Erythrobacter insulae]TRD11457.1 hypothetical protein FGU71_06020 [Erythrobacter insulae]